MGVLTFSTHAMRHFSAEPQLVYEILIDYDSYAEWAPLIAKSKLLAKEGELAIAEFELVHKKAGKVTVEAIHGKNRLVLTRVISGKVPVFQWEWTIAAADKNECDVTLSIEGNRNWNWLAGGYRDLMSPKASLDRLQSELAVFQPELAISDAQGEKILELSETDEGLVCWLRGKKYILNPATEGKS
jgi:ribosome-associated toxin RatA of RatAB toxin-antitoxin module